MIPDLTYPNLMGSLVTPDFFDKCECHCSSNAGADVDGD